MRLFVDKLINIDFSYLDAQRGLVGETWLASVELQGELDDQGMVCDFSRVKKTIRNWLEQYIDHCLLVPSLSPSLLNNTKENDKQFSWGAGKNGMTISSPRQAISFIPVASIDAESVAQWCISQLMPQFPSSISHLDLSFKCESITGPFYHYSHGLKKHLGNCQRIAHGHRSKIEIWINGKPAHEEMQHWANKWKDIYIGSEEDLVKTEDDNCHFAYRAEQGEFSLKIPQNAVYLINTDTTVELIAQHIANKIKASRPQDRVKVKAYEGLGKGAIVEC